MQAPGPLGLYEPMFASELGPQCFATAATFDNMTLHFLRRAWSARPRSGYCMARPRDLHFGAEVESCQLEIGRHVVARSRVQTESLGQGMTACSTESLSSLRIRCARRSEDHPLNVATLSCSAK